MIKLYSAIFYFIDIPRRNTLLLLWGTKEAGTKEEVLLEAVFELFIHRSSPAVQETHSPITSTGFKHLTLNLESCGE